MIWKESDLEEIKFAKKASQSSISIYSHINDPNRALEDEISTPFSFHTAYEQNPWWKLDLGTEELIDCIRIENSTICPERLLNIHIELSCDSREWISLDQSLLEWVDGIKYLNINIDQRVSFRYIKISLKISGYLNFKTIRFFRRKYNGLLIMGSGGAFGDRFIAMLNAMYLSQFTNMKFGFVWKKLKTTINKKNDQIFNADISEDLMQIFTTNYINKYFYNESIGLFPSWKECLLNQINIDCIDKKQNFKTLWGYYIVHQNLLFNINEIPENFTKNFPSIWKTIDFNQNIRDIFKLAQKTAEQLGLFFAIHVRTGDLIHEDHCRNLGTANFKGMPIEIILDIIINNLNKQCNIVLFGQDMKELKELKEYICSNYKLDFKIFYSDELISDNLNTSTQRVFYELELMSYAQEIYSGDSGFARIASLIKNGREPKRWFNIDKKYNSGDITLTNICSNGLSLQEWNAIFTQRDAYFIIKKYNNLIENIEPLRRAFSLFFLYFFSRQIEPSRSLYYLEQLLILDSDNILYNMAYIEHLIHKKEFQETEKKIEYFINKDEKYFFDLLLYSTDSLINVYFKNMFFEIKEIDYSYINYLIARIYLHEKNINKAMIYIEKTNKVLKQKFMILLESSSNFYKKLSYSAVEQIKKHLSYQVGVIILDTIKKYPIKLPLLPIYIIMTVFRYKKQKKDTRVPLICCYDFEDALRIQNHLCYRLGNAFVKHPFTFMFRIYYIYIQWKNQKNKKRRANGN
ncbi:discoidin domain-containing protein [Campylobacter jejuni]|nr:discoidin domain-containing protein [Campylobacter jejuni]ELL7168381.1 discoidin domain-containing protein [Campylobacter jejuni]